jgi:tetratricopeptide (TPR) repeat protein
MKGVVFILLIITSTTSFAQQTVFSVLQGPAKLGDEEFEKHNYKGAIEFYESAMAKDPGNTDVLSKASQCYWLLKDYKNCVEMFRALEKNGIALTQSEIFNYAEAQAAIGNYRAAIASYKKYLDGDKQNELVSKKIWALSNIGFLQEDSSHYKIKLLETLATKASEMGVALNSNGIVFTSNRKGSRPIDMAMGDVAGPYYELYVAGLKVDSATNKISLSKASRFAKSLGFSYNVGPVAFYNHNQKMIFVASAQKTADDGSRQLGLYFAELKNDKWKVTSAWPHNSENYSISDITINDEGNRIYFSSNMRGGIGGKDLYVSVSKDNTWSKPSNLGDAINTKRDEAFPYLHRNGTLYFSSDGLPGIGGLDIFRSTITKNGYSEPENIGYPINSQGDDFGLAFDSLAIHGYFSSNRLHGGLDDDIYEFQMDLQTYPFQMTGVLKYKDHNWSDTLDIHTWGNVKLSLIDTWQNITIQETTSGPDGDFVLTIPYFSRYHILVTDENDNVHKASLELEKYRTEAYRYEIVIVKELFAKLKEQGQK